MSHPRHVIANSRRADGREFLAEAARVPVHTSVEAFPLERANDALVALKHDAVRGAAVLVVDTGVSYGGKGTNTGAS